MRLIETYKKQGGFELFKKFVKTNTFFIAICDLLILGRSRTSLELIRLSSELQTLKHLKKRYKKDLLSFQERLDRSVEHIHSKIIWFCWFQGIENAPEIVRICYNSLKKNIKDYEIKVITEENYKQYVCFPAWIQEKIDNQTISRTHFSDLLRLELLCKYGGTWIDSTVFCSTDSIPDYMLESDLFLFQNLKPGRDGHSLNVSSWLITACSNNDILLLTKELLYQYWKTENSQFDYFLLHYFIEMVFEVLPDERRRIVPSSNATPHVLLLNLFEPYEEKTMKSILSSSPFHKLSYKFDDEKTSEDGTYYKYFLELFGK